MESYFSGCWAGIRKGERERKRERAERKQERNRKLRRTDSGQTEREREGDRPACLGRERGNWKPAELVS